MYLRLGPAAPDSSEAGRRLALECRRHQRLTHSTYRTEPGSATGRTLTWKRAKPMGKKAVEQWGVGPRSTRMSHWNATHASTSTRGPHSGCSCKARWHRKAPRSAPAQHGVDINQDSRKFGLPGPGPRTWCQLTMAAQQPRGQSKPLGNRQVNPPHVRRLVRWATCCTCFERDSEGLAAWGSPPGHAVASLSCCQAAVGNGRSASTASRARSPAPTKRIEKHHVRGRVLG